MNKTQILVICGALMGALFPSLSLAGEWENFKDLQAAMVRSTAKVDRPLPNWSASLDWSRPAYWYWLPVKKREQSLPETRDNAPVPPSSAVPAE